MSTRLVSVSQIARAFLKIGAMSYGRAGDHGHRADGAPGETELVFLEGVRRRPRSREHAVGPRSDPAWNRICAVFALRSTWATVVAEMECRGWTPASSCVIR
jgi:hypothetical protein